MNKVVKIVQSCFVGICCVGFLSLGVPDFVLAQQTSYQDELEELLESYPEESSTDTNKNSSVKTNTSTTGGGWVSKPKPRATSDAASEIANVKAPIEPAKSKADKTITSAVEGRAQRGKSIEERQHLIAPGDAISLLVFGEPDLSVENARVPESGRVSFPLIGSISVGGQTTQQIENTIRSTLSAGYVKNPRLSVSIFSYRPIFIRGAVRSTGSFPYTEGLSVAKAIALAGGSKNSAKANGVSVLRDGETVESGLALDSQKKVASGDVITIAEELGVSEDPTLFIYLHGEVAKPGEYLYRRGLTVEKAIVLAGGFTLRGSQKKIKVTRYAGQAKDQEPIKVKGVKLYTPIEPGDVIKIGARWF